MKQLIANLRNKLNESGITLFWQEICRNPFGVGAACPSSKKLARNMAAQIPVPITGFLIELGAGTGVITEALLERGITAQQVIVIERSTNLSQHLKNRFPTLRVIEGDASHLVKLLGDATLPVSVVVSSLPFRSLPKTTVDAIHQQLEKVLHPGGLLIQFAYFTPGKRPLVLTPQFKQIATRFIWGNIPPARIYIFQRIPDRPA